MKRITESLLALPVLFLCLAPIQAEDGVTIKGKIVVPQKWSNQIKSDEIPLALIEQVQTESPPVPANWNELDPDEQDKWWNDFQISEAGKAFIAEQDKRIEAARTIEIKVEPDGKFVVYDVPAALYHLGGRVEKKFDSRDYSCEVYGQLQVLGDANEVILGDLEIVVSPQFKAGEPAPDFQLNTIAGKTVSLKSFAGNHLLLSFWAASSPPGAAFQKDLQKIVAELPPSIKVSLLAVSLDEKETAVSEFSKTNGTVGEIALTGGWTHSIVSDFGLHGIPSLWLVGPNGKFLATDHDFGMALRNSGLSLTEIIQAKVEGKDIQIKDRQPKGLKSPDDDGN